MIAVYLLSVVLANLIATFAGPAGSIGVAALLIGLDMHARDMLHARWGLSLRLFGLSSMAPVQVQLLQGLKRLLEQHQQLEQLLLFDHKQLKQELTKQQG